MNIVVCIKHVPDTESKINITPESDSIDSSALEYIVNPYDEYAVEEALKIKEAKDGEVTILCLGPANATKTIRTALAMGADKAIHIKDETLLRDASSTAEILTAAIREIPHDIVFFGKQSVDADNGQVGLMVATMLKIPAVSEIVSMECGDSSAQVKRNIEGGTEVIETPLPAVFTAQKGLNEPRYASLKGIMAAKKKPIDTRDLVDVDPKTKISSFAYPPERPAGKIVGEGPEAAAKLFELLQNEAKVL